MFFVCFLQITGKLLIIPKNHFYEGNIFALIGIFIFMLYKINYIDRPLAHMCVNTFVLKFDKPIVKK